MSGIVVGVDGSEGSRQALEWAVDEATRRGTPLKVVLSWEPSVHAGSATRLPPHDDASIARAMLEDQTRPYVAALPAMNTELVEGKAAKVLTDRSADADLLVVGASGHGGLAGRRLGSVTQHCVSHASCTVVVVRT